MHAAVSGEELLGWVGGSYLMRRRRGFLCAVLLLGGVAAACVPDIPPLPPQPEVLAVLNEYRAAARLPPVVEDRALSADDARHARYMAHTGVLGHSEDPGHPYFTEGGSTAATQSNAAGSDNPNASDRSFIEQWMTAPFHAVGVLDPHLTTIGYGAYRNPSTPIRATAALNVLAGRDGRGTGNVVTFPGNGATVGLTNYGREWPNALSGCPGYGSVAGLPITIQFLSAQEITSASLFRGVESLELCHFDGDSYSNPDPIAQETGREVLSTRNAAVLIPRASLVHGATYSVSVTTRDQSLLWSFNVS